MPEETDSISQQLGLIYEAYKRLWADLATGQALDDAHAKLSSIFYNLQGLVERGESEQYARWARENIWQFILAEAKWQVHGDKAEQAAINVLIRPDARSASFIRRMWHSNGEQDRLFVSHMDLLVPYVKNAHVIQCPYESLFRNHERSIENAHEGMTVRTVDNESEIAVIHKIGSWAAIDFNIEPTEED